MSDGDPFDESRATGVHQSFNAMVGEWEGTTRTWFEPGVLADESPTVGTIRPILSGRFLLHEYEGSLDGNPLQGVAIYGYNLFSGKYEMAWVDNFHNSTSILFSQGEGNEQHFSTLSHYPAPEGPPWGWRTEIQVRDPDHIVITHYNIPPGEQEAVGVETNYTRRK